MSITQATFIQRWPNATLITLIVLIPALFVQMYQWLIPIYLAQHLESVLLEGGAQLQGIEDVPGWGVAKAIGTWPPMLYVLIVGPVILMLTRAPNVTPLSANLARFGVGLLAGIVLLG